MSDKESSIKDILSSLTPAQLYTIGTAFVAIIVGTYMFGSFVQKTQSGSLLSQKDNIIQENSLKHAQETGELENKIKELEREKITKNQ
ncbi:hypothetical protein [Vibrio alginolyticus]|uniref:hypothetical protein n=1 Tax=Vibrio alginolyticus TaxID=663 RepID=UPI001BD482D0|nr:hypothetical protein [Vibrio alginolyticus]MBT0094577.1 hypothetical protein [Vibrio alginolyticus]